MTSGSLVVTRCHHTNATSTTTPLPISAQMPTLQPNFCPSWMPKTSRNMPRADSTTPTTSNRRREVSSEGTSRQAATKAITPTGTFTKKIHSQPRPPTRSPPTIGPVRVATPATAPHRLIARPRWAAGKVRVMTAMVCGVIIAAPRPWAIRATIRAPTVDVSPHHSEARVNTASPQR